MGNKIPDKRAMEKMTSDLSRVLQGQNFESEEDLKAYLDDMVIDKKIPNAPPKSAIEFAQDIMYEAWEAESKKDRIKLSKEALSISPDCADAYNLLAEEEAKTLEEAMDLYQKGVEAGRGLMECLWELASHDEAISHARKMLKLNTSDNQGIRYVLIAYLSELGRYDELEKFMNRRGYKDDCAADWLYTKALLAFVKEGDSESA